MNEDRWWDTSRQNKWRRSQSRMENLQQSAALIKAKSNRSIGSSTQAPWSGGLDCADEDLIALTLR